jgi:alanine-synthesizing transaminase
VAAASALNGTDAVIEEVRNTYRMRRDVMVESFARAGWKIPSPKATMFVWSPIPDQFAELGSLEFAKLLIEETGVAVAPGVGFGEYGDQYVRLALVENEQRIRQAARNIKKFLSGRTGQGSNVVPLSAATK